MASALVLVAVTAGSPWLFVTLAGSPIPERIPSWEEITAALSRRDDGTLFLGFLTYVAWGIWLVWVGLVVLEAAARIRGRSAPRIPGLDGPQRVAALLIAALGAAVIGTTASVGRVSALPASPQGLVASTAPPYVEPASAAEGAADPGSGAAVGQDHAPARLLGYARPLRPEAAPAQQARRPQTQQIVVRFEFDSAELSGSTKDTIAKTARDIREDADPARPVVIVGHADSRGPADYNQQLSVRRARAVREAVGQLVAFGFRFEVSGKGEDAPIAAETRPDGSDDPDGRTRNRRVEITYSLKTHDAPPVSPTTRQPQHHGTDGGASSGSAPPSSATPTTPSQPALTPSGTPSRTETPPASATPQQSPSQPPASKDRPVTVDLPSGAVVGLSFAAGVGTALAVSRLHRRRRHRTPATGPDLARSEPPPSPTLRRLRRADLEAREAGRPDPAQPADEHSALHLFPLASSGNITLGVRDDDEVTVPIGGLLVGLTGPGADAAARALLLTLLTHAGDHDVEILIPQADAARLLTLDTKGVAETADHVRALAVAPDLATALQRLESERIHRARLLDPTDGHADLAAIRQDDPTEPLPRLVLIGTPEEEHQRRLEAVCASAGVYDVAIVVLGEHPAGPTLHLDDGGHVTTTSRTDDTEARQWRGLRLFHVATDETSQVLEVIRAAHGAPEPEPEPPPPSTAPAAAPPSPPIQPAAVEERPVRLRVLGPPALTVDGRELATGIRGSARELLTYLALHADGTSRDAILETLWPQVDQRRAVMRFHAAVNDVRRGLRRATRLTHENFIIVTAERYRIDPDLITVDLWVFQAALHQAAHADDDQVRAGLLQQAGELYEGNLAAEHTYEWIEPEREALRRQAVETLIHLAELHERADKPERALAALDRAQAIDRYAEEIYQRTMVMQARMGRPDAVRRTHRLLESNLEDLGVDPSEETQKLLWRLLHPGQQSRARVGSEDE